MLPKEVSPLSYPVVLDFLSRFTNYERRPPRSDRGERLHLARIEQILLRLGSPQQHFEVIHIAGSKGKGSTATMTAALLSALGLRVGLYTSPHLHTVRERICLDGRIVSREEFAHAFTLLQPILNDLENDPALGPATYFEILTAMAFSIFANASVDVAVVEVGLGGRFDATNTVSPAVVGITPISLDHTASLGTTLEAIASEKAGILKPGVPVVLAPQTEATEAVFLKKGEELGCPLRRVGTPSLQVRSAPGAGDGPKRLSFFTWKNEYERIPQPLMGAHQAENAALAVGLVEAYLERHGKRSLNAAALKRAWHALNVPGRMEIVSERPLVILDGAHNPASIWVLSEAIREAFPDKEITVVFGAARDKDVAGMINLLLPTVKAAVLTQSGQNRALPVEALEDCAHKAAGNARIEVAGEPIAALDRAREISGDEGLILVTGSLYLVGAVRGGFFPDLRQT